MLHHQTHICAITSTDLSTVKALLEITLGDTLSASHRLEVFARLAGYRTYAALKADIQNRIDIFGNQLPTPLYNNPNINDPFILCLPVEVRRKLAILEQVGLLRMLGVALEISNDPVFGNIGLEQKDLAHIFQMATQRKNAEAEVLTDGENRYFEELPAGRLIMIASPDNLADLRSFIQNNNEIVSTSSCRSQNTDLQWFLSPTYLEANKPFVENPRPEDLVVMADPNIDRLAALIADGTLVFFSKEDLEAFSAFVVQHTGRRINPRQMISVKTAVLDINCENDASFFETGYYGTAACDVPDGEDLHQTISGNFAVQWLSEIANIMHGCAYEWRRMMLSGAV